MSKFMRMADAEIIFPLYKKYPHIKATESLLLMQIIKKWDTKKCIRVGDSYYYIKDHPNVNEMLNTKGPQIKQKKGTHKER